MLLRAASIAVVVLWIYWPVCNPLQPADWLWDDGDLLTENPTVQHRLSADPSAPPASLATLLKLWLYPADLDYFPLSYTALWAQWPFFSMDPRTGGPVQAGGPAVAWSPGYHLTSVVLHVVSAILLWRLLSVMKLPGAWLAGVLFAVHPVCVESVAWVAEIKNTLSMPLFLLAAIEYVRFDDLAESTTTGAPDRKTNHYAWSVAFFLLAMLAKTSMVAFPVVIPLYTWWKRHAVTARDLARAAPFFLISLVLGLVTVAFQFNRGIGDEKILVGGFLSRLATAGMSVLWYVRLLFWPDQLLPMYPRWEVDPPRAWQFLPWAAIAVSLWWCFKHRSTWGRHVILAAGFFLLMVAPVLGFVTMAYMRITWAADHFVYLPMIGPVALVAAATARLGERQPVDRRLAFLAGTSAMLTLLAILSSRYAGYWISEDALWTYALTRNDSAWQAHSRLGIHKLRRGHVEDVEPVAGVQDLGAFHHLARATTLRPDLAETHNNLGTAYMHRARLAKKRGDSAASRAFIDLSIAEFIETCRLRPNMPQAEHNLMSMLAVAGRFEEAAERIRRSLERHPDNPQLLNNYGVALYQAGKKEAAIEQYRRALEIAPDYREARGNLAAAAGEGPAPAAVHLPADDPRQPPGP